MPPMTPQARAALSSARRRWRRLPPLCRPADVRNLLSAGEALALAGASIDARDWRAWIEAPPRPDESERLYRRLVRLAGRSPFRLAQLLRALLWPCQKAKHG